MLNDLCCLHVPYSPSFQVVGFCDKVWNLDDREFWVEFGLTLSVAAASRITLFQGRILRIKNSRHLLSVFFVPGLDTLHNIMNQSIPAKKEVEFLYLQIKEGKQESGMKFQIFSYKGELSILNLEFSSHWTSLLGVFESKRQPAFLSVERNDFKTISAIPLCPQPITSVSAVL